MRLLRPVIFWLSLWLVASHSSSNSIAQVFDERFDDWPVDLKIAGTVLATDSIAGLPIIAERLAGQSLQERLPSGEPRDGEQPTVITVLSHLELSEQWTEPFTALGFEVSLEIAAPNPVEANQAEANQVEINQAETNQAEANQAEANQAETNQIEATGDAKPSSPVVVWLDDRLPHQIPGDERQRLEQRLRRHLESGGTLVVAGPHIELLSKWTRHSPAQNTDDSFEDASENIRADAEGEGLEWRAGLGLFPDCIVMLDAKEGAPVAAVEETPPSSATSQQLARGLEKYPRCVGLRVAPNSVLLLSGRKLQVLAGTAAISLDRRGESDFRVEQIIAPRRSARQRPAEWLVDLTQCRRRAIDGTLEPFPPLDVAVPHVPSGALVIVGGGGLPTGLMERFVELAGGAEQARLVYVPCEEADEVSERASMTRAWQRMGVKEVAVLHTKDRLRADRDEAFSAPLKEATGIWFGGGRQWNLADSYYGTTTQRLMKEVLQRGGVIGGSSAGASIQARYLARATPIENFDIMAPGYERGGLGFINGVAIDQHFSQRQRQSDMTQLVARYPQLLGIGIDETTAIIVQQSIAQVMGEGKVYFYDANRPAVAEQPDYEALPAGEAYDLANRRKAL